VDVDVDVDVDVGVGAVAGVDGGAVAGAATAAGVGLGGDRRARAARASICWRVMTRSARPRPTKATAQWAKAPNLFLKPVRKVRCTASQTTQPTMPPSATGPNCATALNLETAATVPRSR
jgi:hypothetical protein